MTIAQLKSFLEVAKYSSITSAASMIYISQSALSRQIMSMENELGFTLFERNGNNIKLTKAGEEFRSGAERTCSDYELLCHKAELISQGMIGTLHIGILEDQMISRNFNATVKLFHKRYPLISFDLKWMNFSALHQGLMDQTLDFAYTFKHNEEFCASIQYLSSECEEMYLTITEDFEYPPDKPIFSATLPSLSRQYPFVALLPECFEHGSRITNAVKYNPDKKAYDDKIQTIFVDSTSQRALYVSTGLGFTIVTKSSQILMSPGIRIIPIPDCLPVETVFCYNRTTESPIRSLFAQVYQEVLQQEPAP